VRRKGNLKNSSSNPLDSDRDKVEEKIIGILGGMGPEATADLFYRIIKATTVKRDQDHPRTIIYSNSKVPDRTPAILGDGPSPLPEMVKAARALETAGADFIIIPCNTAHHFIGELRGSVGIPILHMIELTAKKVGRELPRVKRAGLIATVGTFKSGIYDKGFYGQGIEIIVPHADLQRASMEAIYEHIKTGDLEGGRKIVLKVAKNLVNRGAQAVICGCTEISLVLKDGDLAVPVIDPLQILAETAVGIALGRIRLE
jgi:aspartate racemase